MELHIGNKIFRIVEPPKPPTQPIYPDSISIEKLMRFPSQVEGVDQNIKQTCISVFVNGRLGDLEDGFIPFFIYLVVPRTYISNILWGNRGGGGSGNFSPRNVKRDVKTERSERTSTLPLDQTHKFP